MTHHHFSRMVGGEDDLILARALRDADIASDQLDTRLAQARLRVANLKAAFEDGERAMFRDNAVRLEAEAKELALEALDLANCAKRMRWVVEQ